MENCSSQPTWTKVRFGDVVQQVKDKVDAKTSGLNRYIAGEHMDTDDLRIRRWGEINDDYLGPAFHMRFKPGQVLYGSRRTYLRKVAVPDFEGICANTTFVLESKDSTVLLPELLPFIMQTEAFHAYSIKNSKGSVNPYINFSDLAQYDFALPPLAEQLRLAEMLNASEASVHYALEALHSTEVLLQAAVESVAELAAKQGTTVSVEQLVRRDKPITYGILKPGTGYPGGIPVIKVKDYPNGEVEENGLLLTSPDIDAEYRRSRLEAGDMLISIRGTIGRLTFVPSSLHGANITQDTARLSLLKSVNHDYIRFMMESVYVQRQIISRSTGMAVRGINIGELKKVKVPLVDRQRQDIVSDQLSQIRQSILTTQSRYRNAKEIHRTLLSRVLEGEL